MKSENSRRGFAKGLLKWSALTFLSTRALRCFSDQMPFRDAVGEIFRQKDSARTIGEEFLTSVSREADAAAVVDSIASALSLRAHDLVSLETARALLKNRVQEDFRSGNTVSLRGWVLSLTEAQACAFVALNRSHKQR